MLDTSAWGVWPFVAITGLLFGSGGLIAKALVDDGVDPFTLTWVSFLISGALGLAIGISRGHLNLAALPAAAVMGIMASAGPALLFNIGFDNLPTGIVTLLISVGPVITAVVSHFVYPDERFNKVKAGGLALAITGVAILAAGSISGDGSPGALALVMAGSVLGGLAAVLARTVAVRHGAPALIAPQLAVAGLSAMALGLALDRPITPDQGWELWHALLIGFFGLSGYIGFGAMMKANEVGTTGQVSIIGYCVPVFGVIGGLVFFGDALEVTVVVGGLLILLAVGIIAAGSGKGSDLSTSE